MIRVPVLPTVVVAAAVVTMIGLGFWQLDRAGQKERLLASYAASQGLPEIAFPTAPLGGEPPLFRRAKGQCLQVTGWRQVAGQNARREVGYAFLADCRTGAEGPGMVVDAGWSANPQSKPQWTGGPVEGVVAPDKAARMRLVSASGLGGLVASAPPSPEMIPNNHRSYAVQWFAFAAIALIIYGLALAKRAKEAAN
ncbi:SURF1 family protein [Sphingomonas sp. HDW15A]|uniref:SURF1 family protein n=1 Tax=Sphingomonas sp. HDW15A TaxID=2714942 RepID=UPI00140748FC|nr:SURF1 family protein [Sphingomonas sp. HDW15A]QIK95107.1 SURF1 family protein [Sphingomonas sp. HDW15A]